MTRPPFRTQPLRAEASPPLAGIRRVPGDKSISHRALMLGGLAIGETLISGLLEGEDVLSTAAAMRALGATAERLADGRWRVAGRGVGGLIEPEDVLDLGNSGTSARLLLGLIAGHPISATMTGDASLRRRPMQRVAEPLRRIGAEIRLRQGGRMPLFVAGAVHPVPIEYRLPVPSAQVKSAILLAGLNTPGRTTVIEPEPTRDHSERMIRAFGGELRVMDVPGGGRRIDLTGQPELVGREVTVPGDPSSAAFPLVAAALVPSSQVTIEGVMVNPLRAGLFQTLKDMGANIAFAKQREADGEPVADVTVATSRLKGVVVPAERAPSMIDEYPILAVAAAFAEGTTEMHGLGELRVKESDRLAAIAEGLAACGVATEISGDTMCVHGKGRPPAGGGTIRTGLDHRIAMAFLVLGLAADKAVTVDDASPIATSFPDFVPLMRGLGARIVEAA
ncbi:MAG: 3-phosphoshikimate 1-carboxyvinyltransferase [Alphaproteobacteria bacterium]|nr:3-phosphoshikimate 1-carboxyvinyltransferase [Alphaproteobacteria bacterium]